jgi:hypothetical protein
MVHLRECRSRYTINRTQSLSFRSHSGRVELCPVKYQSSFRFTALQQGFRLAARSLVREWILHYFCTTSVLHDCVNKQRQPDCHANMLHIGTTDVLERLHDNSYTYNSCHLPNFITRHLNYRQSRPCRRHSMYRPNRVSLPDCSARW